MLCVPIVYLKAKRWAYIDGCSYVFPFQGYRGHSICVASRVIKETRMKEITISIVYNPFVLGSSTRCSTNPGKDSENIVCVHLSETKPIALGPLFSIYENKAKKGEKIQSERLKRAL